MKIAITKSARANFMTAYNEGKLAEGSAQNIGGNITGDRHELNRQMLMVAQGAERASQIKSPFAHLKVSVSPQDANLSNRTFRKIGEKVLERLGYENVPFVIYRHNDTAHPHIHIILSRVGFDGKLTSDSFDGLKCRKIERELEREFELTERSNRLISGKGIRMPGHSERYQMREKQAMTKDLQRKGYDDKQIEERLKNLDRAQSTHRRYVIQAHLESIHDRPTEIVYLKRMERRGIEVWRHEFSKNGKPSYGLTYKIKPELIRSAFMSTQLDGIVAGMPMQNTYRPGEEIKHPFYGHIPGSVQIGATGKPELCLYDTKPVEQLQPMSFRASNLGPLLMHDSVIKGLSLTSKSTFKAITVERSRSKLQTYERTPFTANESALESSLLLAAETRSSSRVKECLATPGVLESVQRKAQAFMPEDLTFIREVKSKIQLTGQPGLFKSATPSRTVEQRNTFEEYAHLTGRKPNEQTRQFLELLQAGNFPQVKLTLERAGTAGESRKDALDPEVTRLSGIPIDLHLTCFDFRCRMEPIMNDYVDSEYEERKRQQREARELMKAIGERDYRQADRLLSGKPDLKLVPMRILESVEQQELSERLRLQMSRSKSQALLPGTG